MCRPAWSERCRQDHPPAHPGDARAPDLRLAHDRRGRCPGQPGGGEAAHRHDRTRIARVRGPDGYRESPVLGRSRRPRHLARSAGERAARGGPRRGGQRAHAHLLGGHEAPAGIGPSAAPPAGRPAPRRADHRPRPPRARVASGARAGIAEPRDRGAPGHPQPGQRPRAGQPGGDPERGTAGARPSGGGPVRRRAAQALRQRGRGDGRVIAYGRRAWIVLWKDWLIERRSRSTANTVIFFALVLLFAFQFALGPDRERLHAALPGLLWLAFVLTGLLGLGRAFLVELENDCWEGLVLAPGDKSAIYVGKLAGNFFLMIAVEVVVPGLFGLFYGITLTDVIGPLAAVIALGTLGLAAVGTLFGA